MGEQAWTSSILTGLLSSDSLREEIYSSLQFGMLQGSLCKKNLYLLRSLYEVSREAFKPLSLAEMIVVDETVRSTWTLNLVGFQSSFVQFDTLWVIWRMMQAGKSQAASPGLADE